MILSSLWVACLVIACAEASFGPQLGKKCPRQLRKLEYGIIDGPDQDYYHPGDALWYFCNEDYYLDGHQDVFCTPSGKWNHPPPVCKPLEVPCKRRDPPAYGSQHPDKNLYKPGTTVKYRCRSPFVLKGREEALCLPTGQWSHDVPTCVREIKTCPRPDDPKNGRVVGPNQDEFKPGQKIWFRCDKGYTLVGDEQFTCQRSGEWDPKNFPVCVACPRPSTPDNGRLHPDQKIYKVGQRVDFKCNDDFKLVGAGWIKCLNTGKWTAPEPKCIPEFKTCPRPDDPKNGRVVGPNQDEFKPGQKIWFECDKGYTLVGDKDFKCQKNGEWNPDEFPVCVACPRPRTPDNGRLHPDQKIYRVGQRVDFKCNDDFKLVGAGWIKCLDTGKWTAPEPKCVPEFKKCPRPDDPKNGRVVGPNQDEFKPGQKIWFECNKGYTLVGDKDFKCQKNGEWDPEEFPVCVACPRPSTPDNGRLHPDQKIYRVGQRVDFKCDDDFKLVGAGWIKCLDTGKWTAPEPKCVPRARKCPRPDDPKNGKVVGPDQDDFKPGQKIWFQCNKGFKLVGAKDFKCLASGSWHPRDFPVCIAIGCPKVPAPKNGRLHPNQEVYRVHQRIDFKCNKGFKLVGAGWIKCLQGGKWTASPPKCVPEQGPRHITVVACEGNYRVYARCPRGYKIYVVSGFYGRKNRITCPSKYIYNTKCEARGGLTKLRKYCYNRSYCRLYPSNRVFGDPCKGTHKYVQLTYYCAKSH